MIKRVDEKVSVLMIDLEYLLSIAVTVNGVVSIPISGSGSGLLPKMLTLLPKEFERYIKLLRGSDRSLFLFLRKDEKIEHLFHISSARILEKEDIDYVRDNIIILDFSYKFIEFLHTKGITKYDNISNSIRETILIPDFSKKYLDNTIEEIIANDLINKVEFINFLSDERQF